MRELVSFDYAIIRVVPRVEREEFLNVGAVIYSATAGFLRAKIECEKNRLQSFAPGVDWAEIEAHLTIIPQICKGGDRSGPIGALPQRARWHWLVAPRSTVIQLSPVHAGLCADLDEALDNLMNRLVRPLCTLPKTA